MKKKSSLLMFFVVITLFPTVGNKRDVKMGEKV